MKAAAWRSLMMFDLFVIDLCWKTTMLSCVATSCKELYQCNPALPSGYYNIVTPQGVERVYCEMNTTNCGNTT